jgi:hypothetical protein
VEKRKVSSRLVVQCEHKSDKSEPVSKQITKGAFTPNVKSVLIENLGGIFGGTQCWMGDYLILSEC